MSASISNRGPSRMPSRLAPFKPTPTPAGGVAKRSESKLPRAPVVDENGTKLVVQNVYAKGYGESAAAASSAVSSAHPTIIRCQGNCRTFPRDVAKKHVIIFGRPTVQYFSRDRMQAYSLSNKGRLSDPIWSSMVLSHSEKFGAQNGRHTYGSPFAKTPLIKRYSGPATFAMTYFGDMFVADFLRNEVEELEEQADQWYEKHRTAAFNALQSDSPQLRKDGERVAEILEAQMESLDAFIKSLRRSTSDKWETVADVWIKSSGRSNNKRDETPADLQADKEAAAAAEQDE